MVTGVLPVGVPVVILILGLGARSKLEVTNSVATIEPLPAATNA